MRSNLLRPEGMLCGVRIVGTAVLTLVAAAACSGGDDTGMRLSSPDFEEGKQLPERFTCLGDNVPPVLRWRSPPDDAKGFAVVVEDIDAPRATFTNWVVTGLPDSTRVVGDGPLPDGAIESKSSSGTPSYSGPCPLGGTEHRFRFRVHALRAPLTVDATTGPVEARDQIEAATAEVAELEVRFRHP